MQIYLPPAQILVLILPVDPLLAKLFMGWFERYGCMNYVFIWKKIQV